MKKLVFKTILITLAGIILALAVAFGASALFAPRFVAGIFDGVGAYSASVFFYEKQYEKSDKIEDLVLLIDKIDSQKDLERAEKHLQTLVNRQDFDDYCTSHDEASKVIFIPTKDYYCGNLAVCLFNGGKTQEAIDVCKKFADEEGYTLNNPYRALIVQCGQDASVEFLNDVKQDITAKLSGLSAEEKVFAEQDIEDINQLINTKN